MPDFSASAELFVHFLIYAYNESLMAQYLSVMRALCLVMKSVSAFPVIVLCQVMWFYPAVTNHLLQVRSEICIFEQVCSMSDRTAGMRYQSLNKRLWLGKYGCR